MRPGPSREIVQRIESIEGCPIIAAIENRYLIDMLSYRQLCRRWSINTRTLMRLLRHHGVEPRRGSEAVMAQWIHAPEERHAKARETMRANTRRLIREGRHPRLGHTKENHAGTFEASEKLKQNTSARRKEVREKSSASHILYIKRNPSAHCTTWRSPTSAEAGMIDHLQGLGLKVFYNHIVSTEIGPRWVNIFIPSLNLGIECEHASRFPLDWERHCAISALGIRVVYITNKRIGRRQFGGLDKYIAWLKAVRPHPTAHGQNSVIWGRINHAVFKNQPDQLAIEPISVDSGHTLLITTATDDPILSHYRGNGFPPY